jgi:hypothetical protein
MISENGLFSAAVLKKITRRNYVRWIWYCISEQNGVYQQRAFPLTHETLKQMVDHYCAIRSTFYSKWEQCNGLVSYLQILSATHEGSALWAVARYCRQGGLGFVGNKISITLQQMNPITVLDSPEDSERLMLQDFKTIGTLSGKVVSLTHRPPLPPGNISGTYFC